MQTIEVTIDEALLAQIDRVTSELALTRAAFIRQALEEALRHKAIFAKERQHALGYERAPVEPGEFDQWEDEQVWEQS
ncbi:MAG TPA: ribbon-helix-helix protein, CopG family [Blastocatellia bacterium]|nr:ribbon-helix-helix protein, CopG family [Blastocatellia bacterium]